MPTFGLVMISTAPISRARIAASVLGPVNPEQTTTGTGFRDMSSSRKVRPSIRGISRSRRMTCGATFFILSMAMSGSAATLTRNPRFSESTDAKTWRTIAESSTTRTFSRAELSGEGAEGVSAKSWRLSERTSLSYLKPRFEYGGGGLQAIHSVTNGLVAAPQNAESTGARARIPRRRENFWRDELQFIGDAMKAFRMAQEQISAGGQMFSKRVDNFYFRFPLEIDENVAAEDQVKRTSDVIRFASKIEPLKPDHLTKFVRRLDFAFVRAKPLEQKPSLIVDRNAGNFLSGPDAGGSTGQDFG